MSIGSISFTIVNLYDAPSTSDARPAGSTSPASKAADADDDTAASEKAGGRRSKLVEAMMEALKQLGLTGSPVTPTPAVANAASTTPAVAAPAATVATRPSTTTPTTATKTTTAAATPAVTTTAQDAAASSSTTVADTVPQAVAQFAHALWTALQGSAKSATLGVEPASASPAHHHHHRTHGSKHGYDSFAQRLEALASASDPVVVAPATATTSGANSATAADPAAVKDTATTTAETSPLVDAFGKLVTALRGTTAAPTAGTDDTTLLNRFLHTLAHALQSPSTEGAPAATGTLVNVTA